MPLTMISVGAKTLAALVSGLTMVSPMVGGAQAKPVSVEKAAHVAPAVMGPNLGSVENASVNLVSGKTAAVTPSLFSQGGKNSVDTYSDFTDAMKESPLSSSNTGGIFSAFALGPTADDASAADALASQWAESGVPENANVVSKNLNVGVPSYTPVELDLNQGWNGQYIQVNVNNEQEAQLRLNIIKSAESKYGLPYIWGGNDPNVGLDCSGFAKWVYAQQGITINRVVKDIRPTIKPIAEKDAKPGDLVFVNGTQHIGIVLDASKHTYWEEPHPGSFAQIGNYAYGSNVTFGTVINNTESPVGVDSNAVLNKVNNSNATTAIQVGDKNTKALQEAKKKAATAATAKSTPTKSSAPTPKPSASSSAAPKPSSTPSASSSSSAPTSSSPAPSATSASAPTSTPVPKPSASSSSPAKPSSTPAPSKSTATASPKPSASSSASSSSAAPRSSSAPVPSSSTASAPSSSSASSSATASAVSPTALPTVLATASPLASTPVVSATQ